MIVLDLGGSLVSRDKIEAEYIRRVAEILRSLDEEIAIVVGGGRVAREYISAIRELGGNFSLEDEIGIMCTRLNAFLMIAALGKRAYHYTPKTIEEAIKALSPGKLVVMAVTEPGHTTDAVAALLAERTNAKRLIIATNVDGVYDKDPRKYPDAKKIKRLSPEDLVRIVFKQDPVAGISSAVDHMAALIIKRAKIKTYVIDGKNLEELKRALRGEEVEGSVIE